jgi:hypothetical protein
MARNDLASEEHDLITITSDFEEQQNLARVGFRAGPRTSL